MIEKKNTLFCLHTANTTYAFALLPTGHLEHLYYGERLSMTEETAAGLREKSAGAPGNSTEYSPEARDLCLDDRRLEFSGWGKGDYREPMVALRYADGNETLDYLYEEDEILEDFPLGEADTELPFAYVEGGKTPTLCITLLHKEYGTRIRLYYRIFEEADVITRVTEIANDSSEALVVKRAYSAQLDLAGCDYRMTTFNGAWAREMNRHDHFVESGMHVNEAFTGVSSNRANPFVMISRAEASEEYGEVIASNLAYSGNHIESLSVSAFGKTRFLSGMHDKFFEQKLLPGEKFISPENCLTYSKHGFGGISKNMHFFVREHIVRGQWKQKDRPVLLNSWEASYFRFNESKILKLARKAKACGIELMVLDDGWFGKRNSDNSSLGDWQENRKKLPGGLQRLSKRVHRLGMDFGIWVEPEMVNEDSELYKQHPDWAMKAPKGEQSLGRNQMLLDLTRSEVQDYIIEAMSKVFATEGLTYVKWDMNRNVSEYYSAALPANRQGEVAHRYVLGLYRVMRELITRFPNILFEGCASGGNRFDLGILSFFPQNWASDNTDALCRTTIQSGYSYGYPQSVMTAHVSNCPNHQTLRTTSLATRFRVAMFGVLGYECNLNDLSRAEREEIRKQVELYKKYRHTLQYGDFYRLQTYEEKQGHAGVSGKTPRTNITKWMIASSDRSEALAMMVQDRVQPDTFYEELRLRGLDEESTYSFDRPREKYHINRFGDLVNAVAPIHISQGSLLHKLLGVFVKMDSEEEKEKMTGASLMREGVKLHQAFGGVGYSGEVRLFQDGDSELYFLRRVDA